MANEFHIQLEAFMIDFRITYTLLMQSQPPKSPYQGDFKKQCVSPKIDRRALGARHLRKVTNASRQFHLFAFSVLF